MIHTFPAPRRRLAATFALGCAITVSLAACSSSDSGAGSGNTPAGYQNGGAPGAAGGGGGGGAAASGEIAQISGSTWQVQSTSAQSTVTVGATTTYSQAEAGTLADVTVGSCVTGVAASTGSSSGTAASAASAVTATTVRITAATDGTCTGGRTGGGGTRPSGAPTNLPSGAAPSGAPSGAAGGRGGFGGVSGKVTAVSGSTITVATTQPGSTTTGKGTITVTSATKYTTTFATTSAAAKVGVCAVVQGSTDSSGAVTARSVALSAKTDGACATAGGFGGGRPDGTTNG